MNTFSSNPLYIKIFYILTHVLNTYRSLFRHPWETVSKANWIKYPNQITPHVTNVDYLSRRIDPLTGHLHTERLLSCKQNVPDFVLKLIGGQNSSIVYERSVVDLEGRRLVLRSTNLTYSHLLTVEETCTYESIKREDFDDINNVDSSKSHSTADWTRFRQEARVSSFSAWNYLRDSLEDFSVNRFQVNAHKGRAALENVINGLINDTKNLITEKFGEFGEEVHNFIRNREDPLVQDEATQMAEEAIVEQE